MGRSVLAYQFVAGLESSLKSRLAGVKGTFDQLLVKTRFEEAKACDLSFVTTTSTKMQLKETTRKSYHTSNPAKSSSQNGTVVATEERTYDKVLPLPWHCTPPDELHIMRLSCPRRVVWKELESWTEGCSENSHSLGSNW